MRKAHPFCGIHPLIYTLSTIIRRYQTNPNWEYKKHLASTQKWQSQERQELGNCYRLEEIRSWQMGSMWYAGLDRGAEKDTSIKTNEIQIVYFSTIEWTLTVPHENRILSLFFHWHIPRTWNSIWHIIHARYIFLIVWVLSELFLKLFILKII